MIVWFGLLGLAVGSFLNVLILRWGEKPLTGRSVCPACKKQIAWYDLIPVFSWLVLRGRCRSCKGSISPQYPLIEAATGVLFALLGAAPMALPLQLLALPIAALLIAIAVYDFKTTLIPDMWVWLFNGIALLSIFLFPLYDIQDTLYALLAGPLTAFPLFSLWHVSRGRWMGFGDVKLALGMGWLLGIMSGPLALFLGFVLGAVVSVLLLALSSPSVHRLTAPHHFLHRALGIKSGTGYTMKSEIPFGPFLIASTIIVWISGIYGIVLVEYLI